MAKGGLADTGYVDFQKATKGTFDSLVERQKQGGSE